VLKNQHALITVLRSETLLLAILALMAVSACKAMPTDMVLGCPASPGWTWRYCAALQWEEIQPDFKLRYPKATVLARDV
jgi:hypothetical protein